MEINSEQIRIERDKIVKKWRKLLHTSILDVIGVTLRDGKFSVATECMVCGWRYVNEEINCTNKKCGKGEKVEWI